LLTNSRSIWAQEFFYIKDSVPDKVRWFLGKGKTSFHGKRSFPLPQTPTLFKKSGVLFMYYSLRLLPILETEP
ncbi:MAG: hypothetical protein J6W67_02770, partial [Lentisphaeria bacterium]|nr:hypothetical protein [Lentisphaeria bacterium]